MPIVEEQTAIFSQPVVRLGHIISPNAHLSDSQCYQMCDFILAEKRRISEGLEGLLEGQNEIRIPRRGWDVSYGEMPIIDSPEFKFKTGPFSGIGRLSINIDCEKHLSKLWTRLSCHEFEDADVSHLSPAEVVQFYMAAEGLSRRILQATAGYCRRMLREHGFAPEFSKVYEIALECVGTEDETLKEFMEEVEFKKVSRFSRALQDDKNSSKLSPFVQTFLRRSFRDERALMRAYLREVKDCLVLYDDPIYAFFLRKFGENNARYTGFAVSRGNPSEKSPQEQSTVEMLLDISPEF